MLVAYYSLSGFTEKLAAATAAALAAHSVELSRIVPARPYSCFSAGVRGVREAMAGTVVERLAGLVRERGYVVLEALSVFCYRASGFDEAAGRAAAAFDAAAAGDPADLTGSPCV